MFNIFSNRNSLAIAKSKKRIYLDYAAATPLWDVVFKVMQPYFKEIFANPSAIHAEGRCARNAVDEARGIIATLLKIRAEEITFTSGGTEANNLALFGVVDAAVARGARANDIEIISTAIEHPSVLETLEVLKRRGVTVHFAPVDEGGLIDIAKFAELLSPKTLLVTIAYVNSEIGVVQDVRSIVRVVRSWEREEKEIIENNAKESRIYVHIDASQAPLWLPCAMDSLGIDMMTLDAGKCYGPKGVGVLAHKRRVPLVGTLFGGDQEQGLRPGTENVPLIVGCAHALRLAQEGWEERARDVAQFRDMLFSELEKAIPDVLCNGSRESRVANNCNVSIPGVDGEFAVVTLDTHGIAVSTRSACVGGKGGGSHVVAVITGDKDRANNTIRFTLGEETTKDEILETVKVLSEHVNAIRHSLIEQ